jgi:3-phenylpropionate/trans-cinnamate dioxygenase ferredoxin subunit
MIPDFESVARLDDVPEGALRAVVRSNGDRLCLINSGGEICAVSDNCTHQEFAMSDGTLLDEDTIECVWHGARFDVRTGAVKKTPAVNPLPVYHVIVRGGEILVGPRKN